MSTQKTYEDEGLMTDGQSEFYSNRLYVKNKTCSKYLDNEYMVPNAREIKKRNMIEEIEEESSTRENQNSIEEEELQKEKMLIVTNLGKHQQSKSSGQNFRDKIY